MSGAARTFVLLGWLFSCAVCVAAGWIARALIQNSGGQRGWPMEAVRQELTSGKFVAIGSGSGKGCYQLNVFRTEPDAKTLSSVKVWSGGRGIVSVSFHKSNGRIQEVALSDGPADVRDLRFREDGTLEYATSYRYDPQSHQVHGDREHFDKQGKVIKREGLTQILKGPR
jgi:hypothetical protein